MNKIYCYSVTIPNNISSLEKSSFTIEEYDILYENEEQLVIKEYGLTIIDKNKGIGFLNYTLEKETITNDTTSYVNKGIRYRCYSTKKKRPQTLKNKIETFIEKEYGFLSDINLDFIK